MGHSFYSIDATHIGIDDDLTDACSDAIIGIGGLVVCPGYFGMDPSKINALEL